VPFKTEALHTTMSLDDNSLPPGLPKPGDAAPPAAESLRVSAPRHVPEDLRVPWSWSDLLIFVLACIAIGLLLVVVFATGLHVLTAVRPGLRKALLDRGTTQVLLSAVLDLCVLGYLVAQVRLRFGLHFWRTIGWRPLEIRGLPRGLVYCAFVFGGLFLGFAISLVDSLFQPKQALPIQLLFQDRRAALFLMFMAVTVAPAVEETIFRGYIYPVIARTWGIAAGVIVTGVLFGMLHAQQLWGGPWQIASLVFVGIVLTFVRASTRTVLASFLVHTSYNSFQVIATLIGTHGLRHIPPMH
jgi:membrane protease YdiL (CAAX protease family)